jgi:TolB-like protein/tetratricopeptide (TPR) repeat protein
VDVSGTLRVALADRYAIERELGAGGMATVYLARDLRHEREVALKVLRPGLAAALGSDRFLREIKTTAQLAHPHILPLHDSGEAAGFLYYVMPYVEGESLRDRLTREKQLPLDDALRITREVADALGYAHALGLVHRDIKPENILFEAGHAVVADFGIAKAIAAAGSARLTESGLAVGTPQYMSPEQAAGSQEVDGRSDLYALGCVLYEMLAGQPPFTGATADSVVRQHLAAEPPSITVVRPAVPSPVAAALQRALAKTPADRFTTAAQFAAALTTSAAMRPLEVGRPRPRARLVAALLAGLLVVVAGVGVLHQAGVLWPSSSPGGGRATSLVVLPLVNLSGDSTQEYFADGMTEALITELDKVSALTVISRTSAMYYKGKHMPLRAIARELNVQAVVEGSVVREGGQVRVAARLIDGRTDRRMWDSTYDREASGILALQQEVARTIAGAIGATLTPEETARLQVRRRVNPQAYDEYLLGKRDYLLLTPDADRRAIAHYRRAIALDSTFADPHASLVEAYFVLTAVFSMSPRESAPLARAAAERAVALDSGSAVAHFAVAMVRWWWEWRLAEADGEFRRALELNPGLSDAHAHYAEFLSCVGRHDEAVQHALRAVALDPRQANAWTGLGDMYFYAGRFPEAIVAHEKALELAPSSWGAYVQLGWDYSALGRHQEAIKAVGQALTKINRNEAVLSSAAWIYARAGRPVVARGFLDSLLSLAREEWVDPYDFGWAYAWLGETDRALASFSRAIDERSGQVTSLKAEFLPEAFKADPRFHALLRRVRLE